ncbi:hypothetical protein R6Q59_035004 [Mikania micrantha]
MDPQVNQSSSSKVNENLCCQICQDKVILSKSQYYELLVDFQDLKRSKSALARSEQILREKVEAQKSVSPPFNDNYNSMPIFEEEEGNEKHMTYGPKISFENVETVSTNVANSMGKDVNVTNVYETTAK